MLETAHSKNVLIVVSMVFDDDAETSMTTSEDCASLLTEWQALASCTLVSGVLAIKLNIQTQT